MTDDFAAFPAAARTLLMIRYAVVAAVSGVPAAAPAVVIGQTWNVAVAAGAWLICGLAAFGFAWWWSGLQLSQRAWRLGPATVELRKGVIWKSHAVLPRNRVQNVTIDSGPIRRYFGLVNIVVHSAGAATPNILLEGLVAADAEALQQQLLARGVPPTIQDPSFGPPP